jgi:hypothetical protein
MVYAAMQQFGGTLGPRTWFPGAKIPARPFLPVYADGTLYPKERDLNISTPFSVLPCFFPAPRSQAWGSDHNSGQSFFRRPKTDNEIVL